MPDGPLYGGRQPGSRKHLSVISLSARGRSSSSRVVIYFPSGSPFATATAGVAVRPAQLGAARVGLAAGRFRTLGAGGVGARGGAPDRLLCPGLLDRRRIGRRGRGRGDRSRGAPQPPGG